MEDDMSLEDEIDWLNGEILRAMEEIAIGLDMLESGRIEEGVVIITDSYYILDDTQENIDDIEWD